MLYCPWLVPLASSALASAQLYVSPASEGEKKWKASVAGVQSKWADLLTARIPVGYLPSILRETTTRRGFDRTGSIDPFASKHGEPYRANRATKISTATLASLVSKSF